VITDEQTGCGHRTGCRYANPKHPACEARPAMKPRPARAKMPRPREEPNTDRGLNEREAREKPDRESPPNSKKRRVHPCSCSRDSATPVTPGQHRVSSRNHRKRRWLQKKHSSFQIAGLGSVFSSLIGPVCGASWRRKRIHGPL
jgi:hypothetical protein